MLTAILTDVLIVLSYDKTASPDLIGYRATLMNDLATEPGKISSVTLASRKVFAYTLRFG